MTDFPTATIDSVDFNIASSSDEINGYLDVMKSVTRDEWGEKDYPIPDVEEIRQKTALVGKVDGRVIAGLLIVPPANGPFYLMGSLRPTILLPDWRLLREFGEIGEMCKFFSLPGARGKINVTKFWEYLGNVMKTLGSEYVIVNALVRNNAFMLYSTVGFRPMTIPMDLVDHEEKPYPETSNASPQMLMMMKLYDQLPMPQCVYDVDQTGIVRFSKHRFRKV